MNSSENLLPLVLVVDHNEKRAKTLVESLSEISGGTPTKWRFVDHFRFSYDTSRLPADAVTNTALARDEATRIANRWVGHDYPRLVLVDLCMIHLMESQGCELGVILATHLRDAFPQVPIWIYTTMGWKRGPIFSASNAPVEGLLYLDNIEEQADNLWDLFNSCCTWQRKTMADSLSGVFRVPDWFRVEWKGKVSADGPFSLRHAAEALAFHFFRTPGQFEKLELRQMEGGFSGTSLIRVIPYDKDGPLHNTWVIKLAEHAEEIIKLREEISGYDAVIQRIPGKYRPEIYPSNGRNITCILDNWWGGFVLSFEMGFEPLIEAFGRSDPSSIYREVFTECLALLYRGAEPLAAPLNTPTTETIRRAADALADQGRFRDTINSVLPNYKEYFDAVERYLSQTVPIQSESPNGKGFQFMHGDLNCRNIMIRKRPDDGWDLKLIDFPHVATAGLRPAAIDFAKAETELIFLIMDHDSGREIDFTRLPIWVKLISKLASAKEPKNWNCPDPHVQLVFNCARTIRQMYGVIVGNADDDWRQYQCVLLDSALRVLSFADVTAVKRALAIVFSHLILRTLILEAEPPSDAVGG
jgi:CheY-like chemotaxis protein